MPVRCGVNYAIGYGQSSGRNVVELLCDIAPQADMWMYSAYDTNSLANATITITTTNRLFHSQIGDIHFQQGYSPAHETTIQTQLITVIMQALNDILGEFITIQSIVLSDQNIEILAERP